MMRSFTFAFLLCLVGSANAQPASHAEMRAELLRPMQAQIAEGWIPQDSERSVPLAFGMSALVPGAGQVYNGQWKKAVGSLALEAVVLTVWSLTRSKGLSAEDDFRALAHQDWDPAQYAGWLNDYVSFLEQDFGHTVTAPPVVVPTGIDLSAPDAWSATERAAVGTMFGQIQAIERQLFHPETGATFSHQLPNFGDQQYYELIGKYFQFAPGWHDYPAWRNEDGTFSLAIDPERSGQGGSKPNVSDSFYSYAQDHANAQDLLRTASRLSTLFVVNHLVAAIDAAVSAKLHNDRIGATMGLSYVPDGPPAAVFSLRFGL